MIFWQPGVECKQNTPGHGSSSKKAVQFYDRYIINKSKQGAATFEQVNILSSLLHLYIFFISEKYFHFF
jgi:hypothetical protein